MRTARKDLLASAILSAMVSVTITGAFLSASDSAGASRLAQIPGLEGSGGRGGEGKSGSAKSERNGEEEAKRRAEEERKKQEEWVKQERREREEETRRMEEEARERARKASEGGTSGKSEGESAPSSTESQGCFDAKGVWIVGDRSVCDFSFERRKEALEKLEAQQREQAGKQSGENDQGPSQHVVEERANQGPGNVMTDGKDLSADPVAIEARIREKFKVDAVERRPEVEDLAARALAHLTEAARLVEGTPAEQKVEDVIEKVSVIIDKQFTGTDEEAEAARARELERTVAVAIKAIRDVRAEDPDAMAQARRQRQQVDGMLETVSRIVGKLPAVFTLLEEKYSVAVTDEMRDAAEHAKDEVTRAYEQCATPRCSSLSAAIGDLDDIRVRILVAMQEAFSGNTQEVQSGIDEIQRVISEE